MPIYAYKCSDCGHQQDHLMKMGAKAPPCPKCASISYAKQLTSAAFALKGCGYYATDFKSPSGGSAKAPEAAPEGGCSNCPCHPG